MPLAQAKVFYYDFVEIKPWTYELVISNLGLAFVGSKNSNIESSILGFYPNHILVQDSKKLAPYVQQLKEYFARHASLFYRSYRLFKLWYSISKSSC